MINENKIGLEIARITKKDAELVMEWRNDPETLRMSIHTQPKLWNSFYKEYANKYFILTDLPPLFILVEGKRAGFLYFTPAAHPENLQDHHCAEISINISPEYRGEGLGTIVLKVANDWVKAQGYDDIVAIVKQENKASLKTFSAAGYERLADTIKFVEDLNINVPVCQFLARLTPIKKEKVFIIAEAGSNWRVGTLEKDMEMSKKLIDIAVQAGADAIKFQVFKPETIYVSNAGKSGYLSKAGIEKQMKEIFTDLAMPYEMIPVLAAYSQKAGIEFMATAFSKDDFHAIDPYVKRHKIASYEIGHIRLIELAARSGKPTMMSTGAATEEEIAWAVNTFKKNGGKELTLLQCTAKYPAPAEGMNLRVIPWLKKRFKCDVGLSDHSQAPATAPVVAIALGAKVIEKHFTFDQSFPGPDHAFALDPEQLKEMVAGIRNGELMLGSHVKQVHSSEQELRLFARRGIQALRDLKKGDTLQEGVNIDILRPGQQPLGIHPKFIEEIEGKKVTHPIAMGHGLQKGDWE